MHVCNVFFPSTSDIMSASGYLIIIGFFQIFIVLASPCGGSNPSGTWIVVVAFFVNILYVFLAERAPKTSKSVFHKIGRFIIMVIITFVFNIMNSMSASVLLGDAYIYQRPDIEA